MTTLRIPDKTRSYFFSYTPAVLPKEDSKQLFRMQIKISYKKKKSKQNKDSYKTDRITRLELREREREKGEDFRMDFLKDQVKHNENKSTEA